MTMSIARPSAQAGLRYLFKTTMMDDLPLLPDATTYYMKAGTLKGDGSQRPERHQQARR